MKSKEDIEQELKMCNDTLDMLNSNKFASCFNHKQSWVSVDKELNENEFFLFKLKELTYEEKAPRREVVENILGSFRGVEGINFVYMILGYPDHVDFYLGVSLDKAYRKESHGFAPGPERMAKHILGPSIKGNFRGCEIEYIEDFEEKRMILDRLRSAKSFGILEGVPGIDNLRKGDSEQFQSVERLVDAMFGSYFGFVVIAKPYTEIEILKLKGYLCDIHDRISKLASYNIQCNEGTAKHDNMTSSISFQNQISNSTQVSESYNISNGENYGDSVDQQNCNSNQVSVDQRAEDSFSYNKSLGENATGSNATDSSQNTAVKGYSANSSTTDSFTNSFSSIIRNDHTSTGNTSTGNTINTSSSDSYSKNKSKSDGKDISNSFNVNKQLEVGRKSAKDWLEYMDKVLFPRLDNGQGTGLFSSCAYLFCDDVEATPGLYRLANTAISLYSGTDGNKSPLRFINLSRALEHAPCGKALKNLQIPSIVASDSNDKALLSACSRASSTDYEYCGNWLSSYELGLITNVPQKEIIGLGLRKEIDFGLNVLNNIERNNKLKLGYVVQSGEVKKNDPVFIDKKNLDMHTFITGVTGSGKTNTCHQLLSEADLPFLVIEPAKTEYRSLYAKCPDIIYFTPGRQELAPFFLNPLELYPGEAITSRADMLKATMEAAFQMEAAIPQILEAAIYKAYENKGWNVKNNTWHGKGIDDEDGPFADGVYAFPILEDLLTAAEENVNTMGFDQRLRDDYIGSIKARLQSLLVGSKGMMFNNSRSIDFDALIEKKVVVELEEIKNGAEKSLLMGFILTNLLQAIKHKKKTDKNFQHITLIEEAHRLLSRFTPGDSLTKKQGVEVFSDMLAEVRKYGESLIIVDQIPEKMTPEVLKNTSTKIVHKIFAQDDKNVIGNTMALEDNQKAFLSNLSRGRAIVFTQDWSKAIQVQIDDTKINDKKAITEKEMAIISRRYYTKTFKKGVLRGLEKKTITQVKEDDVDRYLSMMLGDSSLECFKKCLKPDSKETLKELSMYIKDSAKKYGQDAIRYYLYWNLYNKFNKTRFCVFDEFIDLAIKKEYNNELVQLKFNELFSLGSKED